MQDINTEVADILDDIYIEKRKLRKLENKYSKDFRGFLNLYRAFSDLNYRKEKCNLKSRINLQKVVVDMKKDYLYSAGEVPRDCTMKFLADVISEVEGIPYVYRKFDLEDDTFKLLTFAMQDLSLMYYAGEETVGVVGRADFFNGLEGVVCDDSDELASFFARQNEKFIMALDAEKEDGYVTLFEDGEVPNYLTNDFPYLSKVCTDIVAMKLDDVELSNEKIYSDYLNDFRVDRKNAAVNVKK